MNALLWPSLYLFVWLVHLWAAWIRRQGLQRATKPLLLLLLLCWYATEAASFSYLVSAALVAGLAGDVLLMYEDRGQGFFLGGLAAFLAGHLLYVAAFVQTLPSPFTPPAWLWGLLLLPVLPGIAVYRIIRQNATGMRPACLAYITVIACMSMAAMLAAWAHPGPLAMLPVLGATLFLCSDTALALGKFRIKPFSDAFIMATYGLAQALLCAWFIQV